MPVVIVNTKGKTNLFGGVGFCVRCWEALNVEKVGKHSAHIHTHSCTRKQVEMNFSVLC